MPAKSIEIGNLSFSKKGDAIDFLKKCFINTNQVTEYLLVTLLF